MFQLSFSSYNTLGKVHSLVNNFLHLLVSLNALYDAELAY